MFKSGGDNRGAIFKEIPIANNAVHDRTTARAFEGHQQRLRKISHQNVRPHNVGNGWARNKPEYLHLTQNVKGAQMQNERYGTISRENQMLLQKIALMEQSALSGDPTEGTWEFRPGVRLNRFQVPVIDHAISLSPKTLGVGSNRGARRRELERITRENHSLVQRIQTCLPSERTRVDGLRRHAAQHERYHNNICQPKLGLGFRSPGSPPSPPHSAPPSYGGTPARLDYREYRQQRSPPTPREQVRRVFTPAGVFEPFERRGEPVPSALLRDAPEGSTQLLVGIASGFVPGAMALVQDNLVPISSASLCREGLVLHLQEPLEAGFAAGTPVRQLRPPSATTPSSSRPATRDGGTWRDGTPNSSGAPSTPQGGRPATGDGLQGGASRPVTRGSRRPRAPWSPPKVRVTCEASPGKERGVSVRLAL